MRQPYQQTHHRCVAVNNCQHEGCVALIVGEVFVGAGIQQKPRSLNVALFIAARSSAVEPPLSVRSLSAPASTSNVAVLSCPHQGGAALNVGRVLVGASLPSNRRTSMRSRTTANMRAMWPPLVIRSLLVPASTSSRASFHQQLHHLNVAA